MFGAALLPVARAQVWSVQTSQFPDYRSALDVSETLRALGFDAYVDFGTEGGRQFSRVRVGCFASEPGAVHLAETLRGSSFNGVVTSDAVAVEASLSALGDAAPVRACTRYDVGFRLPPSWGVNDSEAEAISFWVELDARRRYLRYDEAGWRVFQESSELAALRTEAPSREAVGWFQLEPSTTPQERLRAEFGVAEAGGTRWVRATLEDASVVVVAGGELLWQNDNVAVVRHDDSIVAISLSTASLSATSPNTGP